MFLLVNKKSKNIPDVTEDRGWAIDKNDYLLDILVFILFFIYM